ncbi:MAG: Unknown protein [uncultured Thiotrichaceae bacterium]|uniref:Uncharacterized protein n=1 Tax=uncultured Thiotrichaceae bacterium TaxID=298394 RepID=A0A6S6T8N1_9GAMM|nr:MAG: Unknown protein [uncultured Thiotrichaceae bacterium]
MLEQVAATQIPQGNLEQDKTTLLKADNLDIQRFDMELRNNISTDVMNKIDSFSGVDIKAQQEDAFLKIKTESPDKLSPLVNLDNSFKNILGQMNDVPRFDKFLELEEKKNQDQVRTNLDAEKKIEDPKQDMKDLIGEFREVRKISAEFSGEISRWHLKTQIWSANIKVLTTMVGQASQGLKTLFRSAG